MLLSRPWVLWDVADVEALLAKAIDRSPHVAKLRPDERDELLCQLFEVAYLLSLRFDPSRGTFSSFLFASAQRRAIDWHRSRFRTRWVFGDGRVHERQQPQFVSLDADDSNDDRLGAALSRGGLDDDERGLAAELRTLRARGRRPGGRDDGLGREAA